MSNKEWFAGQARTCCAYAYFPILPFVSINIHFRSSNRNEWMKRWHYSLLLVNSFCPFLRLLIVNYTEAHTCWMVCSDSRCDETCLPDCFFLHTPYLILVITNWRRKWRLTSSLAYSQSMSPLPWRAKTTVQLYDKQITTVRIKKLALLSLSMYVHGIMNGSVIKQLGVNFKTNVFIWKLNDTSH